MRRVRDDAGASLILALIFLTAIGTIVGAIASWTSNDLNNTLVFQQQRNVQSALSNATNVAIQSIRYTPLLATSLSTPQTQNANPPYYCFGSTSPSQVQWTNPQNGATIPVDVWCSTVWNPTSAATRVVTISACLSSNDGGDAATCAKNPGLQTQVTFDDYSASNPNISLIPCTAPPTGTCGSGMTIGSSLTRINSPQVTGLSSTAGPVTGGGTLTVSGTDFQSGATSVNFVNATASLNVVLAGTGVNVTSSTSLTVTIPTATTAGAYSVVVTTANGTSASSSQSVYTYNPVLPTVTGVTTSTGQAQGFVSGGQTVTITGTGFLSNNGTGDSTNVQFIDTQNSNNVYTAALNTVNVSTSGPTTGTQLTAATPAISSTDMTYYVVVVTAPGGSSGTSSAPTFTYQPLLPLVASAVTTSGGSTQGGPGAQLTITGVGFVSGNTTVQLVPTSGTGTLTLTGVVVNGSTSLTGTLPSGGTVNRTYYVVATTPTGNSGTNSAPQFTYT